MDRSAYNGLMSGREGVVWLRERESLCCPEGQAVLSCPTLFGVVRWWAAT